MPRHLRQPREDLPQTGRFVLGVPRRSGGRPERDPVPVEASCGMGAAATRYLLERRVRVIGADVWSWDAPFVYTARRYAARRDPRLISA
ncbi:MAG: cyclase family protein [Candidatus Contendobacter sp.]|nr:MAG: cyclase family protein [Candidatus Contendobacter sp.]